jgi:hypothetical protein
MNHGYIQHELLVLALGWLISAGMHEEFSKKSWLLLGAGNICRPKRFLYPFFLIILNLEVNIVVCLENGSTEIGGTYAWSLNKTASYNMTIWSISEVVARELSYIYFKNTSTSTCIWNDWFFLWINQHARPFWPPVRKMAWAPKKLRTTCHFND